MGFTFGIPLAVAGLSLLAVKFGRFPTWLAWALVAATFLTFGIDLMHEVSQSCAINESECVGATAASYILALGWFVAILLFAVGTTKKRAPQL